MGTSLLQMNLYMKTDVVHRGCMASIPSQPWNTAWRPFWVLKSLGGEVKVVPPIESVMGFHTLCLFGRR
jgi:hypothetical protein